VRFYRYLLDRVDVEAYGRIQEEQLSPPIFDPKSRILKYIDPIRWFESKLALARAAGLADHAPLKLLDIGAGPGHFPVVAEFYGHKVVATDLPTGDLRRLDRGDLFDRLIEFFDVTRVPLEVLAFTPLPDLGGRYDMVTAFLVTFSSNPDGSLWGPEAWDFFLRDIRDTVLRPGGDLIMRLNNGRITEEVWQHLSACATEADDKSKLIRFDRLSELALD
jgi:SAM-dependent methyltransferase